MPTSVPFHYDWLLPMSAPPTTTFSLLEQARRGDSIALTALFERSRRRLSILVHYKLGPEARRFEDVEDIVQETMMRAFRNFDGFSYRSPGSFLNWLSSIAEHVIVDRARFHHRDKRAGEEVRFRSESNPLGPEPLDSATPSRVFSRQQQMQQLTRALDALPEDYRRVILLAKIEGLSTGEMAIAMGKSRDAVAVLLYRAVRKLRGFYESERE
jgi:RNA polymerase sigma-70 factor (ECF subfamily)